METLQNLAPEYWAELQRSFKNNWPKNISGYYILETQRTWSKLGLDYGFKVYCPFGLVDNGMVSINEKDAFYEVVIQCGTEDTTKLEQALCNTNVIDWNRNIIVPYAPRHIIKCIQRALPKIGNEIDYILPSKSFIFHKTKTPFLNTALQNNVHFDTIKQEHVELVNSKWPHRYPNSTWYFTKLIEAEGGYGLFIDTALISWVFINEAGTLGHMYTLENYRRKGYAEMLLKHVCNKLLRDEKDIFAYCVEENVAASAFYTKLGFQEFEGVSWCYIKPRTSGSDFHLEEK